MEPTLYPNLMPEWLAEELRAAHRIGIRIVTAPGDEFDALAVLGDPLIYVVLPPRVLVVCQNSGYPAHHSVLADGRPVLAAGEVSLAVYRGQRTVLALNAISGHYLPDDGCLVIVREVFEALGFVVPNSSLPP